MAPPKNLHSRNALVTANLGLAYAVVDRLGIRRRTAAYDDAVQAASLALVEAADRFDPSRGVTFATFCWQAVSGAAKDSLSAEAVVHVPPKQRARGSRTSTVEALPDALVDDTAEARLVALDEQHVLQAAIETLPEGHRDAVVWHLDRREPSAASLAARIGCSHTTAKRHLQEAVAMLAAHIQSNNVQKDAENNASSPADDADDAA
jgi:RNA polymerase sigma factor (sigma-70 family)